MWMTISRKLKNRWDVYPTLKEVLSSTYNLSTSPFGITETGLQDFRGIKLIGDKDESVFLSVSLKDSDFSGSLWNSFQISEQGDSQVTIENVKFDGSTFKNEYFCDEMFGMGAHFISCSFANCVYKGVDFVGAKLQGCDFSNIKKNIRLNFIYCTLIENCRFQGEIHKAMFGISPLKECSFKGKLYDCIFYGVDKTPNNGGIVPPEEVDNRMDTIDFSQAEVISCSFRDFCYLDKVKPSPQNCLVKITNEFYLKLRELIEQEPLAKDREELLQYTSLFCQPSPSIPYNIYHPEYFESDSELGHKWYNFICHSAEETNCRIK